MPALSAAEARRLRGSEATDTKVFRFEFLHKLCVVDANINELSEVDYGRIKEFEKRGYDDYCLCFAIRDGEVPRSSVVRKPSMSISA